MSWPRCLICIGLRNGTHSVQPRGSPSPNTQAWRSSTSLDGRQEASASFPPQRVWAHVASAVCSWLLWLASLKTDLTSFWSSVNSKFQWQPSPCSHMDLSASISRRPFQGWTLRNTLRAVNASLRTMIDVVLALSYPSLSELSLACFPTTTEKWWATCPAPWSTFSTHFYSKSKIHLRILQFETITMLYDSKTMHQPLKAFGI